MFSSLDSGEMETTPTEEETSTIEDNSTPDEQEDLSTRQNCLHKCSTIDAFDFANDALKKKNLLEMRKNKNKRMIREIQFFMNLNEEVIRITEDLRLNLSTI